MKRALLVFLALGGLFAVANAQYTSYSGYSFNNPVSATVSNMVWERMNARLIFRSGLKRKGFTDAQLSGLSLDELKEAYRTGKIPGKKPASPPKPADPNKPASPRVPATRFKPTGQRVLLPDLINGFTTDEQHRSALASMFRASFEAFEKAAAKEKMENDVALAIAYFTSAAFLLQDGKAPSDEATNTLARAIQIGLDTPEYRKIADLEKQKFYEFMVTMGSYLAASAAEFTGEADKPAREGLKNAAAEVLRKFLGIDPEKVKLSPNGLEKRG